MLRAALRSRPPSTLGGGGLAPLMLPALASRASPGDRRAAVALALRAAERGGGALQLLVIRRADNPRDPWSGDVALPGAYVLIACIRLYDGLGNL